jgi:hypothetical protein
VADVPIGAAGAIGCLAVYDGTAWMMDTAANLFTVTGLSAYKNKTYLVDSHGSYQMDTAGAFLTID